METKVNKKKIENPAKGLDLAAGLLQSTGQSVAHKVPEKADVPKKDSKNTKSTIPDGSWTHFTVICSVELVEKIKAISRVEGFSIRDIVERSFRNSIASYEDKHGKIKVKPKKQKNIADVF